MLKLKLHKILLLNILYFVLMSNLGAADAQQVFQEANQAYTSGNYAAAVEKYESILKKNVFSKELYYNLGNSYYRLYQAGKSVLNYERALRLAPGDKDIQQNLTLARERIVDNIEPFSSVFIVRWWQLLRGYLNADAWSMVALFFLWIGIANMVIWLLSKNRSIKIRSFVVALILIPLSILPFLLAYTAQMGVNSNNFAIVMNHEVPFRISPDMSAEQTATLHEGLKVEIMDALSNLIKVKLPNGEEGWIEETAVEKI